jgi:hypothetical protein
MSVCVCVRHRELKEGDIFSKSTQTFIFFYIKSITFFYFQINKSLQNKKFHFSIQIFLLFFLISIKSFYYSPEREEGVFIAFACLPGDREGIAKIKGKVNEIIYKQMSCKL